MKTSRRSPDYDFVLNKHKISFDFQNGADVFSHFPCSPGFEYSSNFFFLPLSLLNILWMPTPSFLVFLSTEAVPRDIVMYACVLDKIKFCSSRHKLHLHLSSFFSPFPWKYSRNIQLVNSISSLKSLCFKYLNVCNPLNNSIF